MDLISLVVTLIVVGVLLWLITTYIPLDATIRKIIIAVVVIAVVLWLISVFFGGLPNIRIPVRGR